MIANSRILHINSANRTGGTNSSFTYSFNLATDEEYDRCCVLQASVPISYYLVQDGYNTFTLQEGVSTATITVPAGNYNSRSFMTVVSGLLNTASPNGFTYAMTMNNTFSNVDDGKIYYSVSGNAGVQPDFILAENCYEQLGFNANSSVSFSSDSLISTNVINFIPEQTLYLFSSLVKTSKNNSNGILQELVASNDVPYSCITYKAVDVEAYSKEISNSKTNSFTLLLQNENGQNIDLNGRNMILSILLYKNDNFYKIAKEFMKHLLITQN